MAEKCKGCCNHVKNNEEQQQAIQETEIKKLMICAESVGSKGL